MSDVGTQLRTYFDDVVERLTDEDIRVRATTERGVPIRSPRFQLRPTAAVAIGFGIAMTVLGGVFVLNGVLDAESADVGANGASGAAGPGSPWLLVLLMLGFGLLAFGMWSARRSAGDVIGDENMQTIDRPETSQAPTGDVKLKSRNRLLTWLVGILAVAAIGLGGWLIAEVSSSNDASLPAEVQAALDDYMAAWDTQSGDALLAATTESYTFTPNGRVFTRQEQAGILRTSTFFEFEVYSTSVTGDGPYYVGSAEQIRLSALSDFAPGQSIYKIVEEGGGAWKVAQHTWRGDR